jgi:hypothetical protein
MDKQLIMDALKVVKRLTIAAGDVNRHEIVAAYTIADLLAECIKSEPAPGITSSYHELFLAELKKAIYQKD